MFQYEAKIIRVVDGDTIVMDVDLGFRIRIEQVVRLARINAPEIVNWGAAGIVDAAGRFILEACPVGTTVIIETAKSEKYGRWLAEVFYMPGESDREKIMLEPRNLSDELMRRELVKEYRGGRK